MDVLAMAANKYIIIKIKPVLKEMYRSNKSKCFLTKFENYCYTY